MESSKASGDALERCAVLSVVKERSMLFTGCKWIWNAEERVGDEYCEFYATFSICDCHKATMCDISVDTDYALYINGKFVDCNQYGDFEWYKSYDSIDVTPYLTVGKNHFALIVYHCGVSFQRYFPAEAGAIFQIRQGETVLLCSDEKMQARRSKTYLNGRKKKVSNQLGFTYAYDATKEDDWRTGCGKDFSNAVVVEKNCTFYPRPVEKSRLLSPCEIEIIGKEKDTWFLIDLGRETVGILTFSLHSKENGNKIIVGYGEHLKDGHVIREMGNRTFGMEYIAKQGYNEFMGPFLRFSGRYLEVHCDSPIVLDYVGLLPQTYSVTEKPFQTSNEKDQAIYDICVRTLRLCIMEHYVDTPWREQCLYVFDAKNQMLCGYYAFEGGNFAYARANLLLMSKDRREDDLLAICFPCGVDLTIPSFSLYYFMAVEEYVRYSGDVAFIEDVWDKLQSILLAFLRQMRDGLLYTFESRNHWNFYDWSQGLEGKLWEEEEPHADLAGNCLLILALQSLKIIAEKGKKPFAFEHILQETKSKTKQTFYKKTAGLFTLTKESETFTELGNALAILAGLTTDEETDKIIEKMKGGHLLPCSLSMKVFVYEALLSRTEENIEYVIGEIRKVYGKMLGAGATSVWETENGADDFNGSGSLCHGWSSIPVYFYHRQSKINKLKKS